MASIALAVLSPVIAIALVVSAVALRADPVFRQQRLGHGDVPFTIFKIRTLPTTVSTSLDKYHLRGVSMPRVCRMMRKYHIDEMLQLVNVVNGSMSLVGPRPEMPHLVEYMCDEQRRARRQLRPGMTGPWQVSVDAKGLMYEHPQYDIDYVDRQGTLLDFRIIVSTVAVVTKARPPLSHAECRRLMGDTDPIGPATIDGHVERVDA